jgi:hypothetical protein
MVKPRTLTIDILKETGRKALHLTKSLSENKTKESWLHGVVLGLLEASIGNMQSEFQVKVPSATTKKPKRIDFRHGSNNPDVIELVVNARGHEFYGSQNKSELQKLCRIPYSKARRRILLVLDPSRREPMHKNTLRMSYLGVGTGRGKFERHTVTIVYVHPKKDYSFKWKQ